MRHDYYNDVTAYWIAVYRTMVVGVVVLSVAAPIYIYIPFVRGGQYCVYVGPVYLLSAVRGGQYYVYVGPAITLFIIINNIATYIYTASYILHMYSYIFCIYIWLYIYIELRT